MELPDPDDRPPPWLLHHWQPLPTGLRFSLILLNPALAYAENWLRQLHRFLPELDLGGQRGARLDEVHDLASGPLLFHADRFIPGGQINPLQPALPAGQSPRPARRTGTGRSDAAGRPPAGRQQLPPRRWRGDPGFWAVSVAAP